MAVTVGRQEALEVLQQLNHALSRPVWLFGGVAVDFLVGRWTRPHHDIDLNAYDEDREALTRELRGLGFHTADEGWLTHWALPGRPWRLEVVFLERSAPNTGTLVIPPDASVGRPGRYELPPHHLHPDRFGSIDHVQFRVCSPEGEWLTRTTSNQVVAGRTSEPKIEHDLKLLDDLLRPGQHDP